jgi:hypothetical protein
VTDGSHVLRFKTANLSANGRHFSSVLPHANRRISDSHGLIGH